MPCHPASPRSSFEGQHCRMEVVERLGRLRCPPGWIPGLHRSLPQMMFPIHQSQLYDRNLLLHRPPHSVGCLGLCQEHRYLAVQGCQVSTGNFSIWSITQSVENSLLVAERVTLRKKELDGECFEEHPLKIKPNGMRQRARNTAETFRQKQTCRNISSLAI